MLERGFQFAQGYFLQEFLGRGQFGQVWRASAPGGVDAAVKFIDLSGSLGEKEYEGVKRVKQIHHPNLMQITGIWLLDGRGRSIDDSHSKEPTQQVAERHSDEPHWLVVAMLLGGESLQQRLRECRKRGLQGIPTGELIKYMQQAADGLDFLNSPKHDLGEGPIAIQHGDVKPANIVLFGNAAMVCDFGLARILQSNQISATSAVGTPAFMAPEAVSGHPCCNSDQYSLAATYYQLRSGETPVGDGSIWEVLDRQRQGRLDLSKVGEVEGEVLKKAMHLEWQKRFTCCSEMVDGLREALSIQRDLRTNGVARHDALNSTVPLQQESTHGTDVDSEATIDSQPLTWTAADTADPQLQSNSVGQQSGRRISKPVVSAVAGSAILVLLGIAVWKSTSDPKPRATVESPEQILAAAVTEVDHDLISAKQLYEQALASNPSYAEVPFVDVTGQSGPVIKILVAGKGQQAVTIANDHFAVAVKLPAVNRPGAITHQPPDSIKLAAHQGLIECAAIDSTKGLLATGSWDKSVRVHEFAKEGWSPTPMVLQGLEDGIVSLAWHPISKFLVAAVANQQIVVWNLADSTTDLNETATFDVISAIRMVLFSPAGDWLVVGLETGPVIAYKWDDVLTCFQKPGAPPHWAITAPGNQCRVADFVQHRLGRSLVVGDDLGSLSLWQLDQTQSPRLLERIAAHSGPVEAICVRKVGDSEVVYSGSSDGSMNRWDLTKPQEIDKLVISTSAIESIDVTADGQWVAGACHDGSIWLWHPETTTQQAVRLEHVDTQAHAVRFAEDLNWLIGGYDQGRCRFWDLRRAKLRAVTRPSIKVTPEVPSNSI